MLEGKSIPVNPISPPKGSVSRRVPDISKLKSYGFAPKINLKDGLETTIKWYLNEYSDTW